jgi:hypothetical protein
MKSILQKVVHYHLHTCIASGKENTRQSFRHWSGKIKSPVPAVMVLTIMVVAGGLVFSEEERGFTATVDFDTNALLLRKKSYSDEADRQFAHSITTIENFPFGGFDYLEDTSVVFKYDSPYYGGNLTLDDKDGIGGIKIWVKPVSLFKITAGNDIGAGYADSLEADPGMRIYTGVTPEEWDASRDPDNITQDKGILLELLPGPFTLAAAGQYYNGSNLSLDVDSTQNEHTKWVDVSQQEYGYGARVGYQIGEWGKANASYVGQYSNVGSNNYRLNRDNQAVPGFANSEVFTHMFGVYASMTPPVEGLAFSLGYDAVYTRYLDEFYRGGTEMIKTLVPSVYQNGINLNLRYKGIRKLTLRTDHNYSFWTDRDYRIFGLSGRGNYGLESTVEGEALVNVDHRLLWNGLGAAYEFTDVFKLSLYLRNLYRSDTAAQSGGDAWQITRNKFVVEATATYKIGASVELSAGVTFETTRTFMSKEVSGQLGGQGSFTTWASPREITDVETVIKIPVGITMKLQ